MFKAKLAPNGPTGPGPKGANWAQAERGQLGPCPKGPTGPGLKGANWARAQRGQLGLGPKGPLGPGPKGPTGPGPQGNRSRRNWNWNQNRHGSVLSRKNRLEPNRTVGFLIFGPDVRLK